MPLPNRHPDSPQAGPLELGKLLGGAYLVTEVLGATTMSTVYGAIQVRLGRPVVIKTLSIRFSEEPRAMLRFLTEAEMMSGLRHPHIVEILDFDRDDDDRPFLVLERLYGVTLEQRLLSDSRLPIGTAVCVALEIASALAAAHTVGIIHRDLKPGNIMLCDVDGGDFVKLLDFGISKSAAADRRLTLDFEVLGSPFYISPEQLGGSQSPADHRSDQYQLGVVLYEMLAGAPPHRAQHLPHLFHLISSEPPVAPPHISPQLWNVIARALEKNPEDRFPNVPAFAAALRAALPVVSARVPISRSEIEGLAPSVVPPSRTIRLEVERNPLDAISVAFGDGNWRSALSRTKDAIVSARLSEQVGDIEGASTILIRVRELLMSACRTHLGALESPVRTTPSALLPGRHELSREEAYVLAQAQDPILVEDLALVCAEPEEETWALIVSLLEKGLLAKAR